MSQSLFDGFKYCYVTLTIQYQSFVGAQLNGYTKKNIQADVGSTNVFIKNVL